MPGVGKISIIRNDVDGCKLEERRKYAPVNSDRADAQVNVDVDPGTCDTVGICNGHV